MANTPAHEAQKLFFEIGMAQRVKAGAALTELGLGFAQAHALRMLDPDEPIAMSALAERLFCDASNVTGLVDRLEARGLVVRTVDPNDRRIRRIVRTPEGEALRRKALDEAIASAPTVVPLSAAEQRKLCDLLGKIAAPVELPF